MFIRIRFGRLSQATWVRLATLQIPPSLTRGPLLLSSLADLPGLTELLAKYASEAQKEHYLGPMLQGKIRSAFAMTEKGGSFGRP